jgi:hypothetical protein
MTESIELTPASSAGESYTLSYADAMVQLLQERTLATCADCFLPYLRCGMRVRACGCGPGSMTFEIAERVAQRESGPAPRSTRSTPAIHRVAGSCKHDERASARVHSPTMRPCGLGGQWGRADARRGSGGGSAAGGRSGRLRRLPVPQQPRPAGRRADRREAPEGRAESLARHVAPHTRRALDIGARAGRARLTLVRGVRGAARPGQLVRPGEQPGDRPGG